jgi:gamma-glutamylcyclotransferase (GGCT)/AIG2-like uncharacterized protein YtfP
MDEHLFVYGTLMRGEGSGMSRLLAVHAEFVGKATCRGRLYLVANCPGMVPPESPRDTVRGEVYLLHDPGHLLPRLDEYEDAGAEEPESLYRRRLIETTLSDGRRASAWTYIYNRPTDFLRRIESGDFLRFQSWGQKQRCRPGPRPG